MFRRIMLVLTFAATLGVAGLGMSKTAEARHSCYRSSYHGGYSHGYQSYYVPSYSSHHGSYYSPYSHHSYSGHHGHNSGLHFSFGL